MSAMPRREFVKGSTLTVAGTVLGLPCLADAMAAGVQGPSKAKVYYIKECSPENLIKIYAYVNANIRGKVAIKVHTGEPDGPNIIPPAWVKTFMQHIPAARVVECNVLYGSPRQSTPGHRQVLAQNGWASFTTVDIMDEDGDMPLPIPGGKHLKEVSVGKNITHYTSMVVLTHFKGHAMGGFGGALKNIAIGCASGARGKEQLHRDGEHKWAGGERFMERMVEGGKAITHYFGKNITYINVLRNMSVDCDCAGTGAAPVTLPDLGIVASTDILAADKACVDMIYALPEKVRAPLVKRIESRSGLRQLTYMKEQGMGSDNYELIGI